MTSSIRHYIHLIEAELRDNTDPTGPVDPENIRRTYEYNFMRGNCWAFAKRMHDRTGWPIIGVASAGDRCGDNIQHVAVRSPKGVYYDIRGRLTRKTLVTSDWFNSPSTRWVGKLTPEAFQTIVRNDVGGISRESLALADRIIDVVFPEIPTQMPLR